MDILKKFLELTDYTYTYGEEHLLLDKLPDNLEKDEIDNYYIKIGESDTLFTSHLDTAAFEKQKVNHVEFRTKKNNQLIIGTDGSTLLGADDKSGVVIMLNMIEKKVPGLYYFFVGEEVGTVGSSGILRSNPSIFKGYKKCVSFDRRGYGSVITRQMGGDCCSSEFADALIDEFKKNGMKYKQDPTGVFTDSAVFMDSIPECTNLSVGYFNEHSEAEYQNIYYLEMLADTATKIDWESLPIKRKLLPNDSEDPVRKSKKETDLSDDELLDIFFEVDDLLEYYLGMSCINFDRFMPEKEMIFIEFDNNRRRVPVYIHEDGSITIGRETFESTKSLDEVLKLYYGDIEETDDYVDMKDDDNDNDTGGKSDLEYLSSTFNKNINFNSFYSKLDELVKKNKTNEIKAIEMNDILDKYNLEIDSLIVWLFQNGNGQDDKTKGLYWDTDNEIFVYDKK